MRRLHIGGNIALDGWEIFNIQPNQGVDHVGDAKDMSRFVDRSFGKIYCSHVLEHFDFKDMQTALKEWHRILDSEGELYLSVPDLDKIGQMFLDKQKFTPQERIKFVQMMYGGQTDEHDKHQCGFDKDILLACLKQAGFEKVAIAKDFELFQDCSTIKVLDVPISLNVVAYKKKLEDKKNPTIEAGNVSKDVFYMMSLPRLAFTDNLFSLTSAVKELGINGRRFSGVFWEQGMENLIEDAIKLGYKYVLTIDYDTFYNPYNIMDLYNLMEKNQDIGILAPLQTRRGNKYPMAGNFKDPEGHMVGVCRGEFKDGLMPMDTGHFGLTMIRLSEMSKLKKPWFEGKPDKDGGWRQGHKDADVYFWIKAKNAGIKAALAEVWIGHMQLFCSYCGPSSEDFKTYHVDINEVLDGGIPKWALPKQCKPN